jgi:hypothetical protein
LQCNARFESFQQEIFVTRFSISGYSFYVFHGIQRLKELIIPLLFEKYE